jgi:hypothetical protein
MCVRVCKRFVAMEGDLDEDDDDGNDDDDDV